MPTATKAAPMRRTILSVSMNQQEWDAVVLAARKQDQPVSAFIREAAVKAARLGRTPKAAA